MRLPAYHFMFRYWPSTFQVQQAHAQGQLTLTYNNQHLEGIAFSCGFQNGPT